MTQTLSVVIGIAVGVAFILLFGLMFKPVNNVSVVRIKEYSNGTLHFEPQVITTLSGVNNTVKWVNDSDEVALLAADNDRNDSAFYNATKDFVTIFPHRSYEYTFDTLGEIGYHGRPWERGSVIVIHALSTK